MILGATEHFCSWSMTGTTVGSSTGDTVGLDVITPSGAADRYRRARVMEGLRTVTGTILAIRSLRDSIYLHVRFFILYRYRCRS